ncbi:uncharacterized protein CYBJADRAFT_167481 [Cyberlindnera jadinii NRRL Y-1542]|uniref:Cas12f1-like TNB domain-containing protein n=1 Tax=Cyberlindnera jadinii (strain ATCC 18201 / CBS 1600 / BCRC 20928 / JCM 3617 / NBRC 0987 / NRRL Y-1542) TaxID=983966 RepID=A0A1E4RTN5_CYBJN|nr:hypothetical protein CYBJADRAFT_170097 [Cyberlindnera jadinii NRRL Y-1542]XP_020071138.1 hypothetical protein CYBJADRAFT_167481 [Cyberlindnera jadinii NRRL Y-1542]ODV70639.1 hypothetical protein CYBJADRAFT_170097 [Cyberlindnera jadinii NRRL Y-1542]ODV74099.1 hypothetical protein CYBJADRAFT_167481 [Cyberlindnera jadinii NRRL Y-1542]
MTEEYTSKTCTGCGTIKHTMFLTDRIFHCVSCNLFVHRDVNGAHATSSSCVLSHLNRQTHTRSAFMLL